MGDDSYSEDVYSEFEEDATLDAPRNDTYRLDNTAWAPREEESEPDESEREYRSQLYTQLKNSGVIGNVKSQLRAQLLSQLQRGKVVQLTPAPGDRPSLKRRALNHLIASYLSSCPYSYSLTVFKEEAACGGGSQAGPGTLLSENEVMDVFGIEPESFLATAIAAHRGASGEKGGKSFLLGLMHALSELSESKLAAITSGQSEHLQQTSTEARLTLLDQSYQSLKSKGRETGGWVQGQVEGRMASYRQEIEEQSKAEIERRVTRVREVEVAAVRLEEAMKHRKSTESERLELDRMHQERLSKLRQREEDLMDKLRQQQRDVESVAYEHRQKILREEERLRGYKDEVQQQLDARGSQLKNIEKTIEMRERAVTAREAAAEKKIAEATEAAASSAVTVRQQVEREYLDLKASVNAQRMQLEMDRARIMELRSEAASELAGARVREDRIRSLETSRQEAEARAAAHAADAEILRLQCEKLYQDLQHSRDEMSRRINLASDSADAMLQNAAGALSMLDAEANASRGMSHQVREAQKDALEARESALSAKSAKEAAESSLAISQARVSKLEGEIKELKETLKSLELILDEAVEGRSEALFRLKEAEGESRDLIGDLEAELVDQKARAAKYLEELTMLKMQMVAHPGSGQVANPALQPSSRVGLNTSTMRLAQPPASHLHPYPYPPQKSYLMSPVKAAPPHHPASPQRAPPPLPSHSTHLGPVTDRLEDLMRRDRQMHNELIGFRERAGRQAQVNSLEVNGALARVHNLVPNPGYQPDLSPNLSPGYQPDLSPNLSPGYQPDLSPNLSPGYQEAPQSFTLAPTAPHPAPNPSWMSLNQQQIQHHQVLATAAAVQPPLSSTPVLHSPPQPTVVPPTVAAPPAVVLHIAPGAAPPPPPPPPFIATLVPPSAPEVSEQKDISIPPPGLILAPPPGLTLAPPPGLVIASLQPPTSTHTPSDPPTTTPPAAPSTQIETLPAPTPTPAPLFLPPGLSMVSNFRSSTSNDPTPPPPPPPPAAAAAVEVEPPRQFIAQPTTNDLQSIILAKRKALEEERKRRLAEQEKEREREEAEERERERELKRREEEAAVAEGQDESPTPPPRSSGGGGGGGAKGKVAQSLRPPLRPKPKSKPPSDAGSLADLEVSMAPDDDEEVVGRGRTTATTAAAASSSTDRESSNGGFEVGGGSRRAGGSIADTGGESESLPDYDINVASSDGGSIRAPPSEGSVF